LRECRLVGTDRGREVLRDAHAMHRSRCDVFHLLPRSFSSGQPGNRLGESE
jgi:hypothetical protein